MKPAWPAAIAVLCAACTQSSMSPATTSTLPAASAIAPTIATNTPPTPATTTSVQVSACSLVSSSSVASSFGESGPLSTQPMSEAHGPACGYPNRDDGGYVLVVQLRDLSTWDETARRGRVVRGLDRPARLLLGAGPTLYILDVDRQAVVALVGADPDALMRVAAYVYGFPLGSLIVSDVAA